MQETLCEMIAEDFGISVEAARKLEPKMKFCNDNDGNPVMRIEMKMPWDVKDWQHSYICCSKDTAFNM